MSDEGRTLSEDTVALTLAWQAEHPGELHPPPAYIQALIDGNTKNDDERAPVFIVIAVAQARVDGQDSPAIATDNVRTALDTALAGLLDARSIVSYTLHVAPSRGGRDDRG